MTGDADLLAISGKYNTSIGATNLPTSPLGGILLNYVWDSNAMKQVFYQYASNNTFERYKIGSWSSWVQTWNSGNDGSGSGLDADLLGGYQESSFIRRNVGQFWTNVGSNALSFQSTGFMTGSDTAALEIYADNATTSDAFMQFHIAGSYAVNLGLDASTNKISIGGWSMGAAKHQIWHAGNQGAGSGLDADLLDGYNRPTNFGTDAYAGSPYQVLDLDTIRIVGESRFFQGSSTNKPTGFEGDGYLWVTAGGDVINRGVQMAFQGGKLSVRGLDDKIWYKIWSSGNMGASSGLDADLLRGVHWGNVNTNIITSGTIKSKGNYVTDYQATAYSEVYLAWGNQHVSEATGFAGIKHISYDNLVFGRMAGLGFFTSTLDAAPLERMRISDTGNVSIGNNNNIYKLDVSGTGRFTEDVTVPDEVYGAGWNESLEVPTKNAIYDKIETLGGVSYNVYTALITQAGTSAPTVTVLKNTLSGSIVWTRITAGVYDGTLTGEFPSLKVWTIGVLGGYLTTNNTSIHILRLNDNVVRIATRSLDSNTDGLLNEASIEIRVYP